MSVNSDKTFYIHEICDAEGNYIQMVGEDPNKKTSSANFVEPTSTVSAADNGITPRTNVAQKTAEVNKKFSMREPVECTKNLVALHNLTEDKQEKALKIVGFHMPSIAIIKADSSSLSALVSDNGHVTKSTY